MPLVTDGIIALVSIPINALILWLVLKLFKIKSGYLNALKVAAIASAIMFLIGQILALAIGGAAGSAATTGSLVALGGIALLVMLVTIVLSVLVYAYLLKSFYKLDGKKALLVSIVFLVISFVVSLIVGVIIAIIFAAVLFGSIAAGI